MHAVMREAHTRMPHTRHHTHHIAYHTTTSLSAPTLRLHFRRTSCGHRARFVLGLEPRNHFSLHLAPVVPLLNQRKMRLVIDRYKRNRLACVASAPCAANTSPRNFFCGCKKKKR
jgi:hypothetical protein